MEIMSDRVSYVALLDLFAVSYIDSFHLSYPCLQDVWWPQLELLKIFAKVGIKVATHEKPGAGVQLSHLRLKAERIFRG